MCSCGVFPVRRLIFLGSSLQQRRDETWSRESLTPTLCRVRQRLRRVKHTDSHDRARARVCERERECVCERERECVCVCVWERERVCVCVCEREWECVCVCERESVCERERERVCVWECVCVWERERECVCERERESVCERVCVCVCERERESVCVWERERERECVCVCVWERERVVRERVCVCVCERERVCVCVSKWVMVHVSLFLVTIARAIELKHNVSLIAALSFETANFYQKAGKFRDIVHQTFWGELSLKDFWVIGIMCLMLTHIYICLGVYILLCYTLPFKS